MPPAVVVWTASLKGSEEGRLLRHIAPVAKAYGFKICFGDVNHEWKPEDADEMQLLASIREVDCEWTFHDLSWAETNVTMDDLGTALESQVVEAAKREDVYDLVKTCVGDRVLRQYTFLVILPA
ncbi:hypothetical protein BDZ89DRAFT_1075167 [Hymenopellis radicata]|nr:hypothetical protein BDZ89DRAFT_1075167 [Hymenopellis radicata]